MALPDPKPGLVVRYDCLRTHEAAAGRDRGKTRPACLIAATDPAVRPRHVVLLPIAHTPPGGDTVGIEIPALVRQALGLDDAPGWVIVSEHNIDEWPNAGLSPLPGRPDTFTYGFIPSGPVSSNWLAQGRADPCAGDRQTCEPRLKVLRPEPPAPVITPVQSEAGMLRASGCSPG